MAEKRGQLDALLDVELVLANTAAAAGESRADRLAAGDRLGRFLLVRELGAGGMGEVWEARDTDLDRRVALKVMRGISRARLVREARAMARLRHPNVVTVFDAATLDGRDVIALELVEGTTLATWLAPGRKPREVIATLVAAGRGLAAAHAAGIVHRDFKPQNVLVETSGRVVVTDFGLARAAGDVGDDPQAPGEPGALDSPLTMTGAVLGTPAYMAPEQLAGEVADERADEFAFCAVMWEALAGSRPFLGDSMQEIADAIAGTPPRGADRIPRRLRPILVRGLERDPARRWPSIDALLAALIRAWRRPRRIALAVGAAAAVGLLALLVRHELADTRAKWQPHIADLQSYEENSDGSAISPDGKQLAYVSDREQPDTAFRVYVEPLGGGNARAITPPGEVFMQPRWMRDGKALLLVHWNGSQFRIVKWPLDGGPSSDLGPGVGADDCGDVIAIAHNTPKVAMLELMQPDGHRDVVLSSDIENMFWPRCDPGGQHVVVARGGQTLHVPVDDLIVVDREGHAIQLTHGHSTGTPVFAADGRSVVFSAVADQQVFLYEVAVTGGMSRRLTSENGPHLAPDVSRDGTRLVFDRDQGGTMVRAGGVGEPHKLTALRESLISIVATRDGTSLVGTRLREGGNELVVISTRDGTERTLAFGTVGFLSDDERHVLFGSVDGEPRLLSIPIEGGPVTTVAKLPGRLVDGADGPDATYLEIRNRGTEAWRVTRDGKVESLGVEGLVIPARTGGWRLVRVFDGKYRLRFVAPGASLTETAHEVHGESVRPTWLDDHRVAYIVDKQIHIVDVTSGIELAATPGPDWGEMAIVTEDGTHWFQLVVVGHVTRHVIDNFADRDHFK